jgi:hypothetical protein
MELPVALLDCPAVCVWPTASVLVQNNNSSAPVLGMALDIYRLLNVSKYKIPHSQL